MNHMEHITQRAIEASLLELYCTDLLDLSFTLFAGDPFISAVRSHVSFGVLRRLTVVVSVLE